MANRNSYPARLVPPSARGSREPCAYIGTIIACVGLTSGGSTATLRRSDHDHACLKVAASQAAKKGGKETKCRPTHHHEKGGKEHKSPAGRHRSTEAAKEVEGHSPSYSRDPFAGSGGDDADAVSPSYDSGALPSLKLKWKKSDEVFRVSGGVKLKQLDGRTVLPIIEDRLYFQAAGFEPKQKGHGIVHYFRLEKDMEYEPFALDCGPFNLGMTHRFGEILKALLLNPKLANSKLIFYSKAAPAEVTNAIYLLGSFLCAHLGATPLQAWAPFSKIEKCPCLPYRDCTWVKPSPYNLHVVDCWSGLAKAMRKGLYSPADFNKEEYFYYDDPQHGDIHEVVKGKFFAFKGPTEHRQEIRPGQFTFMPSDYCHVFRYKGVRTVIRLTHKEYDRQKMVALGFHHHDLFFPDCTTPPDSVVDRFLRIAEKSQGAIAVHCLAGLGRTGTLIALWMMKHLEFTANEAMAWLRICRPGSVIGPQQKYLRKQEKRMHELGEKKAAGLGMKASEIKDSETQNEESEREAEELSEMVNKAMEDRDAARMTGVRQSCSETEAMMLKAGAAVDATGDDCQCEDLKGGGAGKATGDSGAGEQVAELVAQLREDSEDSNNALSKALSVPAPLVDDLNTEPLGTRSSSDGAAGVGLMLEAQAPTATIGQGRRAGLSRTDSVCRRASKVSAASDSEVAEMKAKEVRAEVANGRRKGLTKLRKTESEPAVALKSFFVDKTDELSASASASHYANVRPRVPSHFVKKDLFARAESPSEKGEDGLVQQDSVLSESAKTDGSSHGASHLSSVKARVPSHWVKKREQPESLGKEGEEGQATEGRSGSGEGPSRQESFLTATTDKTALYSAVKSRVPSHFVRSQSPRDQSPRGERPQPAVVAYHPPVGKARVPSHFVKTGTHAGARSPGSDGITLPADSEVVQGLNAPAGSGSPPSER